MGALPRPRLPLGNLHRAHNLSSINLWVSLFSGEICRIHRHDGQTGIVGAIQLQALLQENDVVAVAKTTCTIQKVTDLLRMLNLFRPLLAQSVHVLLCVVCFSETMLDASPGD